MPDARGQQAREAERAAQKAIEEARRHRQRRDQLVRELRVEDPTFYTHKRLAAMVSVSPELIAFILRNG